MQRVLGCALLMGLLTLSFVIEAAADEVPEWLERITLGGDLRLRHDTQWRSERKLSASDDTEFHRNRERYRLRLTMKAELSPTIEAGVRLASGSGFQNTTNQSFDGHGRGKEIFIDRAYASWKAADWLKFYGGKHKNPLFTTPLAWDPDVNIEGVSESMTFDMNGTKVFATFGQWIVEEIKTKETNSDPALFTFQAGSTMQPLDGATLQVGATYYNFRALDVLGWSDDALGSDDDFLGYNQGHGQQMIFDADGNLLNQFNCWEIVGNLKLKNLAQPVSVFGSYLENTDADIDELIANGVDPGDSDPADLSAYGGEDRKSAWMVGISVGSKKKRGDWYGKYFYQELEDYAFPAVFVDSDFHGGGTNNKGHYVQGVVNLRDDVQLKATGFFTQRQDERKDGKKDEDRIQLDVVLKF